MFVKSALVAELQREIGDSGETNPEHTTRYNVWLDEVYQRIMNRWGWTTKDLKTTATWTGDQNLAIDPFTGQQASQPGSLTIPNDVGQIESIQREDGRPIPFRDKQALIDAGLDLRLRGEEEVWYFDSFNPNAQQNIKFYPAPSESFTVWVHGRLTPLQSIAENAVIPLPNEFIPVLRDGVRALALEAEDQLEQSDRIWQRFYRSLERVVEMLVNHAPHREVYINTNADLEMLSPRTPIAPLIRPRTIPIP